MAKSWSELTLDEAVERAKGVSRQALHIAIKTYAASGRDDIVEQLRLVRKTLKREKRVAKVGKEVVDAAEQKKIARKERIAEFEALESRPVLESNGAWSVTRDGKVWSHMHCRWLRPGIISSGYLALNKVGNKKVYIHRIVATAFIPNPDDLPTVNHKDGNKLNNNVSNLEWLDYKDNVAHSIENGLHKLGEQRKNAVLTNDDARRIKQALATGATPGEVAKATGFKYYTVYSIAKGITWNHVSA